MVLSAPLQDFAIHLPAEIAKGKLSRPLPVNHVLPVHKAASLFTLLFDRLITGQEHFMPGATNKVDDPCEECRSQSPLPSLPLIFSTY